MALFKFSSFSLTDGSCNVSDQLRHNPAADPAVGEPGALPDARLVELTLSGKRDAFDLLIQRHQRKALAVSYRLLGNGHDAAEVTQDAFLKAFSSLNTLEDADKFSGWLMRIVSNLSLNRRRDRKRSAPLPVDDVFGGNAQMPMDAAKRFGTPAADNPELQAENQELGKRLLAAIDQLPEKQRLAMVMFMVRELPQKDIAQALGCSVEAVKWHVFQGRKKLKELLRDLIEEN